ncbi:MAG: hypothetical protein IPP73_12685 [Chitinophagaceae bacterium]|nr:hypothetical protein [Chitinophagaceae bacterium]
MDKEWNKADRSNFVNYPLLPPGNYTLLCIVRTLTASAARTSHFLVFISNLRSGKHGGLSVWL